MTTRLHGVEESISDSQACEREFQVPGDYISQPLHLCWMSQKPLFRYELMLFCLHPCNISDWNCYRKWGENSSLISRVSPYHWQVRHLVLTVSKAVTPHPSPPGGKRETCMQTIGMYLCFSWTSAQSRLIATQITRNKLGWLRALEIDKPPEARVIM